MAVQALRRRPPRRSSTEGLLAGLSGRAALIGLAGWTKKSVSVRWGPSLEGVEEVVISKEVVEGTARPLYIYADRSDRTADQGSASA